MYGVTPAEEKATFELFRIYNEKITIIGSMAALTSYELDAPLSLLSRTLPFC